MNANRNLIIDFRINKKHDQKHIQPHNNKRFATKSRKRGK